MPMQTDTPQELDREDARQNLDMALLAIEDVERNDSIREDYDDGLNLSRTHALASLAASTMLIEEHLATIAERAGS